MSTTSPFPEILTSSDLQRLGLSPWRELERSPRAWERLRCGDYVPAQTWARLDGRGRHIALILATTSRMRDPLPVVSHASAAALWGLPIIGAWPARVEVTLSSSAAGSSTLIRRHRVKVQPDAVFFGEMPVTPPARTVIDLARTADLATAVAAADAAVRDRICTLHDLDVEADRIPVHGPGRRRAHTLCLLVNPRSESVGESLSRVRMYELGFAQPDLQVPLVDDRGCFGRGDFGWPGIIGEFDGLRKYRATGDAGDLPSEDVVIAEKRREDRVRRLGPKVARWTWSEAFARRGLVHALSAAGVAQHGNRPWVAVRRRHAA